MPDSTPNPDPRCPECATPAAEATPLIPWWQRHRRLFQAAALLAALGFLAFIQSQHWPAPPLMSVRGPGQQRVEFPPVRVTRADLERLAGEPGEGGNSVLDRALQPATSSVAVIDDLQLHVALTDPSGNLYEVVNWGWPAALVVRSRTADYRDVYDLKEPVASLIGFTGWRGGYWTTEALHPVHGRERHSAHPLRLGPALVVILAAWTVGRMIVAVLRPWRRLARTAAIGRAVLTLATIGAVIVFSAAPATTYSYRVPGAAFALHPAGVTVSELRSAESGPSDADLARAILDAVGPGAASQVLAVAWVSPYAQSSGQVEGFWPPEVFYGHVSTRRYDGVEPTDPWGPSRWDLTSNRVTLYLVRQETTGPLRYRQYSANIAQASWLLLGLYAAWLAPLIPIRLAMWRLNRRARRRFARGQCVRCGYDGVRPAVP